MAGGNDWLVKEAVSDCAFVWGGELAEEGWSFEHSPSWAEQRAEPEGRSRGRTVSRARERGASPGHAWALGKVSRRGLRVRLPRGSSGQTPARSTWWASGLARRGETRRA